VLRVELVVLARVFLEQGPEVQARAPLGCSSGLN